MTSWVECFHTTFENSCKVYVNDTWMNMINGANASAEGCPYTKENLSYGEYQLSIDMPANSSPPYDVVLTFDANTTIGSCHSNCYHPVLADDKPSCSGNTCEVQYSGTDPLQMFNIYKVEADFEDDRSNLISVIINDAEQCSHSVETDIFFEKIRVALDMPKA